MVNLAVIWGSTAGFVTVRLSYSCIRAQYDSTHQECHV